MNSKANLNSKSVIFKFKCMSVLRIRANVMRSFRRFWQLRRIINLRNGRIVLRV